MNSLKKMRRALALVLALAMALALAGCGQEEVDPKQTVEDAAKATAAAFGEISSAFGMDAVSELAAGKSHEELELYLSDANVGADISSFYGSGISVAGDSDMDARQVYADVVIKVADYDLATIQVAIDDSMLYFGCPELFGDGLFGVNTMTLSQDFPTSEYSSSGFDAVMDFNVFDLVERYVGANGQFVFSSETMSALSAAYDTMANASEWAAGDDVDITSGDDTATCQTYTMSIPTEAFGAFFVDAFDALLRDDYIALMMESSLSTTAPGQSYDEFVDSIIADMEASLAESPEGTVDATFYVAEEQLRGVEFSMPGADGSSLDGFVFFGAGSNVADRFDMELTITDADGGATPFMSITSEGDHTGESGKFTDATVIDIMGAMTMEINTEWDTGSGAYTVDAFAEADGVSIDVGMSGTMTIDGSSLDMTIDDLTLGSMGMSVTLNGGYRVSEGEGVTIDTSNARLLKDLTDEDLAALEETVTTNATSMLFGLLAAVPELAGALMAA